MKAGRNTVVELDQMQNGQRGDCFVLVLSKELRQTRTGRPYYLVSVRGRTRKVAIRVWDNSEFFAPCEHEWSPGQFLKIRGQFQITDYGPQLVPEKVRPAGDQDRKEGFDPASFMRHSRFDPQQKFQELCALAQQHIDDRPVLELVLEVLRRHEDDIQRIPAARFNHHACVGGYVEHVVSVTHIAAFLADQYARHYDDLCPPVNKSVVVAGAILHDIGKLRELELQLCEPAYTVPGRLLGHMLLGRDLVREVAADVEGLCDEVLMQIEHIIAAHQGRPEWGAVVEPLTIECLLVHYADDVDAKVQMMAEARRQDPGEGPFTSRDNRLGRHVYKGERPQPESAAGRPGAADGPSRPEPPAATGRLLPGIG